MALSLGLLQNHKPWRGSLLVKQQNRNQFSYTTQSLGVYTLMGTTIWIWASIKIHNLASPTMEFFSSVPTYHTLNLFRNYISNGHRSSTAHQSHNLLGAWYTPYYNPTHNQWYWRNIKTTWSNFKKTCSVTDNFTTGIIGNLPPYSQEITTRWNGHHHIYERWK